jgi:hypothetical protein
MEHAGWACKCQAAVFLHLLSIYYIQEGFFELSWRTWIVLHARSCWNCLEADRCSATRCSAAALCLRWCMRFRRSGQVFEATTASGLRPLLAILAAARDLRVGIVENFSGRGVGCLHLDFLGALESGCVDVPFCAFEFGAAFLRHSPRNSALIGSCELHIEDMHGFLSGGLQQTTARFLPCG